MIYGKIKQMTNTPGKPGSRITGRALQSFLFFVLYYLYFWLVVDVRFIYHGGGEIYAYPFFSTGGSFLRQMLSRPGGLIEYIGSFLSELLYYSWTGALVITLTGWLLCWGADVFLKAVGALRLRFFRFALPIILLILYSGYSHFLVSAAAMSAALIFVYLYLKTRQAKLLIDVAVFFVLSAVLYVIAGGGYILFACLCLLYELFFAVPARRWKAALLYLAFALFTVYIAGALVFGESVYDSFTRLTAFDTKISFFEPDKKMLLAANVLFLALPSLALLLGLWRIFNLRLPNFGLQSKIENRRSKISWWLGTFVLFALTGAAIFFSFDRRTKCLFAVDYYNYHKQWDKVLEASRTYPDYFLVIHAVDKALYHTGRLSSEMFAYTQHPTALFLTTGDDAIVRWKRFDIYIELGYVNVAEAELTESYGRLEYHPVILRELALINMVKGNMGAARRFLGALSKRLFQARWAKNYIKQLERDPDLSENSRIQHLRSIMAENDTVEGGLRKDMGLIELLEKNRRNRAAFEYLMASYLLIGQLEKFVANLHRLDDFDITRIPRHYEEAILIYERLNDTKVDIGQRQISRQSRQRFSGFLQIYYRHMANRQAAYKELLRDYGDSYFFCYLYKVTGTI